MGLTDPELDLLREMLEDDPASDVFVQVGEELVRRSRWAEAVDVLAAGLARADDGGAPVGYALLARAALECGAYTVALEATSALDIDPVAQPELARIEILALERSGRLAEARDRADRFLTHDPHDVVVTSVVERLAAPPPSPRLRAVDPFYTVERAEAYVDVGRTDRALKVYRRILQANRGDPSVELRIHQLASVPQRPPDDLSVELTDPGMVPEHPDELDTPGPGPGPLAMPPPRLATPEGAGDHLPREAAPPTPAASPSGGLLGGGFVDLSAFDADEEETQRLDLRTTLRQYASSAPSAPSVSSSSAARPSAPIDRRVVPALAPPLALGEQRVPASRRDDLEDDVPTVRARAFPSAPPSSAAPAPAPATPSTPSAPPASTPPAAAPPAAPPAPGADRDRPADLDLLSGTDHEWSPSDDRTPRRLLRR